MSMCENIVEKAKEFQPQHIGMDDGMNDDTPGRNVFHETVTEIV